MTTREKFNSVLEAEHGAAALLGVIVDQWGAKDLIYCMFDLVQEEDQNEFLNMAMNRMEGMK